MDLWILLSKIFAITMISLMLSIPLCAAEEQTGSGATAGPFISKGCMIKGDQPDKFDFGIDSKMLRDGKPCAFIKSKVDLPPHGGDITELSKSCMYRIWKTGS